MMNPNDIRSYHPSSAQIETLIEFLERNPDLAKGFLRTQCARDRSRRQWEELAVRLNSIGGTMKNYKQWNKYWTDKKSAIKKKVAARSAARRRTGGGVEDEVELSELEERVVALCGGESFAIGDTHLGIHPFPKNYTPPSYEVQQTQVADTVNIRVSQQQRQSPSEESATVFYNNQLENTPPPNPYIYHPSLSPPTVTLSHTPTPSPSSCGFTQIGSPVTHQTAASSSSGHAASVASHFRRPRTVCTNQGGSVSSRHTSSVAAPPSSQRRTPSRHTSSVAAPPSLQRRTPSRHTSSVAAPPSSQRRKPSRHTSSVTAPPSSQRRTPSQRRTEFSTITERFLRVEEQQLELQRTNAQILQSFLERSAENNKILAESIAAVGKGLQALAEAMNRDRV